MTGDELTAKFFEACGREVRWLKQLGGHLEGYYWNRDGDWLSVPNHSRPSHLHEVIRMVGMALPAWDWSLYSYGQHDKSDEFGGTCVASLYHPDGLEHEIRHQPEAQLCTALMIAAIRAAGLEVPE